jgi:hypothetical protein
MKKTSSPARPAAPTRSAGLRRVVAVALLAALVSPALADAAGLGDVVSLLNSITSTIEGAIASALGSIEALHLALNNFREQVLWPVAAIDQTKASITIMRQQSGGLLSAIEAISNDSATLANPRLLEAILRDRRQAPVDKLTPLYARTYGEVPPAADAAPLERNLLDIDDALAEGALKTSMLSDQATQAMLSLADDIEQQSATTAPGPAPMLAAQAEICQLESQAYLSKVLASQLRAEAARLAQQNALVKRSAASARDLENQAQQVLTHPRQ